MAARLAQPAAATSKGDEAIDAVLDALSDHEKLSMPLLEDEETGRQFALLILKLLAGRSSCDSRVE